MSIDEQDAERREDGRDEGAEAPPVAPADELGEALADEDRGEVDAPAGGPGRPWPIVQVLGLLAFGLPVCAALLIALGGPGTGGGEPGAAESPSAGPSPSASVAAEPGGTPSGP